MKPGSTGSAGKPGPRLRRIAVVGCSGAGKSRLSRRLGDRLGLPVVHLDAHFWRPGWVETPAAEWDAMQPALFAGEGWVSDGNFDRTLHHRLARADLVVFLDFPRRTCLRGVLGRILRQYGEVRADMAVGCPEGFDREFLRWVWNFRRDVRPRVLDALAGFQAAGGRVVTLRSRREVEAFLIDFDF